MPESILTLKLKSRIKMDPGFRRDDELQDLFDSRFTIPNARLHGWITLIEAGVDLPMPRISGRYMSCTSGGGTPYVPGVTARTR